MSKSSKIPILIFLISTLVLSLAFSLSHFSNAQTEEEAVVYVCPLAKNMEEVNPSCPCRIDLKLNETVTSTCPLNGKTYKMTLTITNYEGKEYYTILGFENGGAGVLEKPKLETQIAITEMVYDEIDILDDVTKDVGDGVAPLLLSELKESSIDLEEYLPENKRMIYPTQKKKLKMKFKFLETAGNEYQEKSINVRFKFKAIQEEQ